MYSLVYVYKNSIDIHTGFSIKSIIQIPLLVILLSGFSFNIFAKIENNQFIQQHWGEDQGLPVGDINGMVQDSQGYIWLASLDGLIRFDGNEFTQFDTSNSDLISNRLTTIRKTEGDVLWISSDEGELIRFKDLQASTIDLNKVNPHQRLFRVTSKNDAGIAYGTLNGIVLINGSKVNSISPDSIGGEVKAIHWPSQNSLWVATNQWLYHAINPLGDMKVKKWPLNQEALTIQVYEDELWMGTKAGLYRFNGEIFDREFSSNIKNPVNKIQLISADQLLINSNKHLWTLNKNQLTILPELKPNGFRTPLFVINKQQQVFYQNNNTLWYNGSVVAKFESKISDLMLEKSGDIIVSTIKNGLFQFKHSRVKKIGIPEGLPAENIYPIFQASNQSVTVSDIIVGTFSLDKKGQYISAVKNSGQISSIAEINHSIWLVGATVCIINQQHECIKANIDIIEEYGAFSLIYQDMKGDIWLAGRQGRMWKHENNKWQLLSKQKNNWIIDRLIQTVLELENGDLLFGTNGNGIIWVRNNQVIDDSSKWGLPSRYIRSLLMIGDQYLLVGTQDQGMCRVDLRTKTSSCIDKKQNLTSISLHYMYLDKLKRVWWSSNRGVFWQKLSSLMDVFDGKLQKLPNGGRYDKNNGMRNSEANGRAFPAGFVDKDDKMWIPTQQGIAIFDTTITEKVPSADALVQGLFLEGSTVNRINQATFKTDERSFQIKLTALSFYNPKNIEFRYRETINNSQNQWIELGKNRMVNITHLPSGKHHFEFSARNTEGQWQNTPAIIDITIDYFWHERRFVQLIAVLLLFGLIAAYIRLRNKKILQRTQVLEQMVKDRTLELKQMGDKRTNFFANISHELRTPLTLIHGPVDDAINQQKDLKLKNLKLVHHSTQRMKRLVDQMLDLQKLDAEKLQLHQSQQHLLNFLSACIEPFQILAQQMKINLFINRQSIEKYNDLAVDIDVEQMEKVIGNLLSNAFKFSSEGNKIEILLKAQQNTIAIKVLDDGPGIPKGANERIFNRFAQETNSKYTTYQGTGIGLALVKEIIELHGGEVKAENRDEGGACFTLSLPFKIIHEKNQPTTSIFRYENEVVESRYRETDHTTSNTESKKTDNPIVLIVEDNNDLQKYIASHLQQHFQLIFANDGEQGLALARSHLPDIIISDVMMPNMDGFEMAKVLRQDLSTNFIPFLFLTAKITAQDELKGLSLGADDYISKPFSGDLLIARIQRIFDSRKRLHIALQHNQHFVKKMAQSDDLKTKAINSIYKNISNPEFNVDAMAKSLFMSRSKLHRLLKAQHDTTPLNLLRSIRMNEANKLLKKGQGNVSEICYAVGYNSLSSFSQIFKETFGVSPSSQINKNS